MLRKHRGQHGLLRSPSRRSGESSDRRPLQSFTYGEGRQRLEDRGRITAPPVPAPPRWYSGPGASGADALLLAQRAEAADRHLSQRPILRAKRRDRGAGGASLLIVSHASARTYGPNPNFQRRAFTFLNAAASDRFRLANTGQWRLDSAGSARLRERPRKSAATFLRISCASQENQGKGAATRRRSPPAKDTRSLRPKGSSAMRRHALAVHRWRRIAFAIPAMANDDVRQQIGKTSRQWVLQTGDYANQRYSSWPDQPGQRQESEGGMDVLDRRAARP